ncbi:MULTISPECIES: hypothetical protein [unclassified Nostoc]|nr:hypothetical protein [Nostoc sp. 'Peltigera membranacea cyanobiont' 232]
MFFQISRSRITRETAIATLLNGGTVYAVPPEQVPHSTPVVAIYRY